MKLERLQECVTIVVVVVFGMLTSLYVGVSAGRGAATPLMLIGGIFAITLALFMREKIWLLIPLCWGLKGQLRGLPGAFPVSDLAILYVALIFFALKALKIVRAKLEYTWLDYLLFANIAYLVTAFIRNPAGTESMGLNRVGGRPYFDVIIVLLGYWILGHISIGPGLAKKIPFLMLLSSIFTGVISFVTFHFPFTVPIVSSFYTGISTQGYAAEISTNMPDEVGREMYLGPFGEKVAQVLGSYFPPFSLLNPLNFWRVFFFTIAIFAVLKSGFRSALMVIALFMFFASYFREGLSKCLRNAFILSPVLVMLVFLQGSVIQLPLNIQRTLSFLPGDWNMEAIRDAESSTEWRIEIWKKVWDSRNRYIENWWFGDGFGYDKAILNLARQMQKTGNFEQIRESLILTGAYHSLPLSTIRAVGFAGFGLYFVLMGGMAFYAWKTILRTRRTAYFPSALFIGIQMISAPIIGLFIYGDFSTSIAESTFMIAMIRLIHRSYFKNLAEENEKATLPNDPFPQWPEMGRPFLKNSN